MCIGAKCKNEWEDGFRATKTYAKQSSAGAIDLASDDRASSASPAENRPCWGLGQSPCRQQFLNLHSAIKCSNTKRLKFRGHQTCTVNFSVQVSPTYFDPPVGGRCRARCRVHCRCCLGHGHAVIATSGLEGATTRCRSSGPVSE